MDAIGILDESDDADGRAGRPASAIVEAAGADAVVGDAPTLAERSLDAIVARGEAAVLKLAREAVDAPILPVDAGRGVHSIPASALDAAIEAAIDGDYAPRERTVLAVAVDGERVRRAVLDVMLVTSEPAKISEYAIRSGDDRIARFRADGVTLATPAGSAGYAASAGGPVLAPGTGLAAVPVAPFATAHDHWVVDPADGVELTVERDEGPVELLVDDRRVRAVSPKTPVSVTVDGSLSVLVGPHSRSHWP
ncbi:NAD+ kinase [Natronoarchaeum philippinense]|uniref:NAD+ kinase n=1 Tax=Natronoarchaeum philippinense TaxID=558529 RepID=A0A285MZB2_NATPI|nr:NAD(+)/NADH kinase [Natronoarchaeum philippinense]SNZ02535.1 NAD+ kinase [Natronoarchaeum philippinense]